MDRKGIFTKEQENFLAGVLDAFFTFKNPLIEKFDKLFFVFLLKTGDNAGLDKLPEKWKEDLIPLVDAALSLNVEATQEEATKILNKRIDIPVIGEEDEALVFSTLTQFIAAAVQWYVIKNTKTTE